MHKKTKNICENLPSFPTRERGLKYEANMTATDRMVVPHEGTWIEITARLRILIPMKSFPTRERGLKYAHGRPDGHKLPSFPTRERGLK